MAEQVTIEGLRELQAALAVLPETADRDLADRLGAFIEEQPAKIQARAARTGKLARMASKSVRANRDREGGTITGGGGFGLPTGHGTYADVFFGAEFGGGSRPNTKQFKPYEPRGRWSSRSWSRTKSSWIRYSRRSRTESTALGDLMSSMRDLVIRLRGKSELKGLASNASKELDATAAAAGKAGTRAGDSFASRLRSRSTLRPMRSAASGTIPGPRSVTPPRGAGPRSAWRLVPRQGSG